MLALLSLPPPPQNDAFPPFWDGEQHSPMLPAQTGHFSRAMPRRGAAQGEQKGFFALELVVCSARLSCESGCLWDAGPRKLPGSLFPTRARSTHSFTHTWRMETASCLLSEQLPALTGGREKPQWLCQQDHHPAGSWQRGFNALLGGNELSEIDHPIKTSL